MTAELRPQTLSLALTGMSCASCVGRAERSLLAVPGVVSATVNLATEAAQVVYRLPATPEQMAGALAEAGYPVRQATVTLQVEGMTCGACTGRVERVLRPSQGWRGRWRTSRCAGRR